MEIDAFYSFKIDVEAPYTIQRRSKVGNNDIFNLLFENYEFAEFNKIGHTDALGDYIAYVIKSLGKSSVLNPIILETSVSLSGCGRVKTLKRLDAILFKISDLGEFEVYIFNGKYSSQVLLLQMLKDGSLDISIESIKSKVI